MSKPILKRTIGFIPLTTPRIIETAVKNYEWLATTLNGAPISPGTITLASFDKGTRDFTEMKEKYLQLIVRHKAKYDNIAELDAKQENDPLFWAYDIITRCNFVYSKTTKKTVITPEPHKRPREEEVVTSPSISFNQITHVRNFYKTGLTLEEEQCYLTSTFDNASPCCKELLAILVNLDRHPATLNTVKKGKEAATAFLESGPTKDVHRSVFLNVITISDRLTFKKKSITLIPGVLNITAQNMLILLGVELILMNGL